MGFTAVDADEYGSGKRDRKDIVYTDNMTEKQFFAMVGICVMHPSLFVPSAS